MARKEWQYKTVRYYGEGASGKFFATHTDGSRIGGLGVGGVGHQELHIYLNQLGVDGWDAISLTGGITEGVILLKREVLYG